MIYIGEYLMIIVRPSDIIYQNLLTIKCKPEKDVLVQIRANFLKNNIDSMKDLLKMYEQDFKDDNRFSLCFRPIIDFEKGMPSELLTIKKEARNLEFDMMSTACYKIINSG